MSAVADAVGPITFAEEDVPAYALPDLLIGADGSAVTDVADWECRRRPELLELFRTHVYGRTPDAPCAVTLDEVETTGDALDGRAVRRRVQARVRVDGRSLPLDILLYLPRDSAGPAPVFLGMNFYGNHSVHPDPGIRFADPPSDEEAASREVEGRPVHVPRGGRGAYWAIEAAVERGYGVATLYCGDVDPDFDDGFGNGAHALLEPHGARTPESWGTIGAWAWGLSRALDALAQDPDVDASRVAVIGHSRLGKTALWAGAQDERFALVISNNSGCGGAALFRRRFGETIRAIVVRFPHWFAGRFRAYADREDALPVDQHQLLALIAPRPLYVASASQDLWADPRGEFRAARAASPAWERYGRAGLDLEAFPEPDGGDAHGYVGYHLRTGEHAVTSWDWAHYLDFADRHLK